MNTIIECLGRKLNFMDFYDNNTRRQTITKLYLEIYEK